MPSHRLRNPYADPLAQSANAIADLMFSQKSPNALAQEQLAGDVARANIEQSRAATAHSAAQTGKIASDQARQGGALGDYIAALTSDLDDTQPGLIQKAQQYGGRVADAKRGFALNDAAGGSSSDLAKILGLFRDTRFEDGVSAGEIGLPEADLRGRARFVNSGKSPIVMGPTYTGNVVTGERSTSDQGLAYIANKLSGASARDVRAADKSDKPPKVTTYAIQPTVNMAMENILMEAAGVDDLDNIDPTTKSQVMAEAHRLYSTSDSGVARNYHAAMLQAIESLGGISPYVDEWGTNNTLATAKGGLPTVAAPAPKSTMPTYKDYDTLPSGATFTDPDGKTRKKP